MGTYRKHHGISMAENSAIENLNFERLTSDPPVVEAGRAWYNTTDKKLKMTTRDESGNLTVRSFLDNIAFDNWKEGLIVKDAVKTATVLPLSVSSGLTDTLIDGYQLVQGDRLLVDTATDARENGIYTVVTVGKDINATARIIASGSDKDDIIISTATGINVPVELILTDHENGTPASINVVDNVATLSLEKRLTIPEKSCYLNSTFYSSVPNSGFSVLKLTAKSTSPYKNFKIEFGIYYTQNGYTVTPSDISPDTAFIKIEVPYAVDEWSKTTQEIIDDINASPILNPHLTASLESGDASKVFVLFQSSSRPSYVYMVLTRGEKYVTTASEILTLINSTDVLDAKLSYNDLTTITPRWATMFGSSIWDIISSNGAFNGTYYTTTGNRLTMYFKWDSGYYSENPLITKTWFNPVKVKITFTGSCHGFRIHAIGAAIGAMDTDRDKRDTIASFPSITSGEEITINPRDGFRTGNYSYCLTFECYDSTLQITNIEFELGTDYNIHSTRLFSQISNVPEWRSIIGPSEWYTFTPVTWNGSTAIGTGMLQLSRIYDGAFKYSTLTPYKPTKARFTFTHLGTSMSAMIETSYGDDGRTRVDNTYVSGGEIPISPDGELDKIQLSSNDSTPDGISITNIEFYDGTTGWVPDGSMLTATTSTVIERSTDANNTTDVNSELKSGVMVFVENGTLYGQTQFTLTTPGNITIGVTPITFSQFTSAANISAGFGIARNGNELSINPDGTTLTVSNLGVKVTDGLLKTNILSLDEVPDYYGTTGQTLVVNVTGDAMEFATITSGGTVTAGNGLQDSSGTFSVKLDGTTLQVGTNGLKLNPSSIPTVPDTVLDLTDIPNTYGTAGQVLAVNSGATGMEFVTVETPTALKNAINANVFRFSSVTPNTSHTVTHNLESDFLDVSVWVYDTVLTKYVNDSVAVTLASNSNSLIVDLTESADIIVIVEKKEDLA